MSERPKLSSSARSLIINAVLTLIAFALLGLAVWSNREQIREVLARPIDARLFGLGFLLLLTALVLTFIRWYVLVRALDLPFRLRDALRLGFIGNVFNLVIPGAVGGDVIKAAFLCREQERKTQAVASMVIDRIVGLLGLFLLAGISGLVAWSAAGADLRRLIVIVWVAAATGLIGLAVLFTPALYHPLHRLVKGRGRLQTLFDELILMASAYRQQVRVVAAMLVLAIGIHTLYVTAFWLVSRALFRSEAPSLAKHLLVVPLVLFTTAVPLPFGALGLSEEASQQLMKLVGHPGGAVTMMGYRVLMYAGGLVSAIFYLANARQVRTLRKEAASESSEQEPSPSASSNPQEDLAPVHPQADQPQDEQHR